MHNMPQNVRKSHFVAYCALMMRLPQYCRHHLLLALHEKTTKCFGPPPVLYRSRWMRLEDVGQGCGLYGQQGSGEWDGCMATIIQEEFYGLCDLTWWMRCTNNVSSSPTGVAVQGRRTGPASCSWLTNNCSGPSTTSSAFAWYQIRGNIRSFAWVRQYFTTFKKVQFQKKSMWPWIFKTLCPASILAIRQTYMCHSSIKT